VGCPRIVVKGFLRAFTILFVMAFLSMSMCVCMLATTKSNPERISGL
jgi:preprotein translocase subunit SecG